MLVNWRNTVWGKDESTGKDFLPVAGTFRGTSELRSANCESSGQKLT